MSIRSTGFLAIVFAALIGYLYFVELPRKTDDAGDDALLPFDEASVSRIELEHPGRTVVLQRQDGSWQMLEPLAAPADQRSVENLLAAVGEAKVKRSLDEVEDLAVFGLDVPSATIRLFDGDRGIGLVEVGKQTPVGGAVYVQRNDETEVLLTDAGFATRIDQKAADLRDKTILDFDSELVRSITIASGEDPTAAALQMRRRDDGAWHIVAPAPYEADQAAVTSLLSTLGSMRAVEFLAEDGDDLARYGLDDAKSTVTLDFADDDPLVLRIGNEREGKLRVQTNRRPTVYAVAAWVAGSIDQDVDHFRDKSIASFPLADAARIEIASADGEELDLIQAEGIWTASERAETVEQDAVVEMLRELVELRGFEIAATTSAGESLAPFGLSPPRRTIRVYDGDGAEIAAVGIGSYVADGARTEYTAVDAADSAPTVFHLREPVYQRLDRGAAELLEEERGSEGAAAPVPDGEAGHGVDQDSLDDAAAAGE